MKFKFYLTADCSWLSALVEMAADCDLMKVLWLQEFVILQQTCAHMWTESRTIAFWAEDRAK